MGVHTVLACAPFSNRISAKWFNRFSLRGKNVDLLHVPCQVFYYHDKPYPPPEGRFRKRVDWAGDISGRDASIVLREVKFTYNGTYVCQVKNPPDVHGNAGEVQLHVVTTGWSCMWTGSFE